MVLPRARMFVGLSGIAAPLISSAFYRKGVAPL
jgi:hypothetical protein